LYPTAFLLFPYTPLSRSPFLRLFTATLADRLPAPAALSVRGRGGRWLRAPEEGKDGLYSRRCVARDDPLRVDPVAYRGAEHPVVDRKSKRLNSSHQIISF